MFKFAANLSMMYGEVSFLDRFALAAQDGFTGVEFLFPYQYLAQDIRARLQDNALEQVLFNMPPGDWDKGERGIACLPGREDEFRRGVERALGYARILGVRRLHVMSGVAPDDVETERLMQTYLRNLAYAAHQAESEGIEILIEPINERDMPGYLLNYQWQAVGICKELGMPNLKVLMDLYHCQIMEGDLCRRVESAIDLVGHIQIAGVPGRHEPNVGEINYPFVFDTLSRLGYEGWIGCEYRPRGDTRAGLDWMPKMATARGINIVVE